MSRLSTRQRRARERSRWDWPVPFTVEDVTAGRMLRPVHRHPRRPSEFGVQGSVLTFGSTMKGHKIAIRYGYQG